jgi:hypothetical protein
MIKHNQDGAANGVMISLVMTVILLVAAIGAGAWAFAGRQDYKNNVDEKIAVAVEAAKKQESTRKDKVFAEEIKNPLKLYSGPAAFGSLQVNYPKTWSGYVDDTGSGGAKVDGYFAPGVVPSISNQNSVFALRIKIVDQAYDQVVKNLEGQQKAGKLTAAAYALPKVPQVVGVRVSGELSDKKVVTMIILPLRSQTLQVWTEGTQYTGDFNDNILPNFSFSP